MSRSCEMACRAALAVETGDRHPRTAQTENGPRSTRRYNGRAVRLCTLLGWFRISHRLPCSCRAGSSYGESVVADCRGPGRMWRGRLAHRSSVPIRTSGRLIRGRSHPRGIERLMRNALRLLSSFRFRPLPWRMPSIGGTAHLTPPPKPPSTKNGSWSRACRQLMRPIWRILSRRYGLERHVMRRVGQFAFTCGAERAGH